MEHKNILITGGAGFVGSTLALQMQQRYSGVNITALDNLKRRGSELNLPRLKQHSVRFVHGDLRASEDLDGAGKFDLVIDCCAEPSVLAGYDGGAMYVINTNLQSTINCLEFARKNGADIVFLSTSRIYPNDRIDTLNFEESETRFDFADTQPLAGVSRGGISENFPLLPGARSLYGATKLASEVLVQEYIDMYGMRGIINRFSVIGGPWQMGKIDQGLATLWMAWHVFGRPLKYIGYGGSGKQVRDLVHVDDVVELICCQLDSMDKHSGNIYNAGGGIENSVSLVELTAKCRAISGKKIDITPCTESRRGDVRCFVTNHAKVTAATGWKPARSVDDILGDIHEWILANGDSLANIL